MADAADAGRQRARSAMTSGAEAGPQAEPSSGTPTTEGGYGFPAALWRAMDRHRPPGVNLLQRWRSPLRGTWLTSVLGLVLLITLPIVIVTGLLSYIAYGPQFGMAIPADVGW